MTIDKLHLEILPDSQRRLWDELGDVPKQFTLYGGTAIALYLGHRESVDFDFFAKKTFDPQELLETIPFLKYSEVIQQSANTLSCLVDREGVVQVSFFGVPNINIIREPYVCTDNGVKIASIVDLAGMKAIVVQRRAEAKDYIDLGTMIEQKVVDLSTALSAGSMIYSTSFNPELTLKALSFYEDGDLPTVPVRIKARLMESVKSVDLDHLPVL